MFDRLDAQDGILNIGLVFEEMIKLAVNDAHPACTQTKAEGLIRQANLRSPNADLRRPEENVVFQCFTWSGNRVWAAR